MQVDCVLLSLQDQKKEMVKKDDSVWCHNLQKRTGTDRNGLTRSTETGLNKDRVGQGMYIHIFFFFHQ